MFQWLWRKRQQFTDPRAKARQIEDDLYDLASRMLACLVELERAHNSAQTALPYASDEAEKSKHVGRKARFIGYRDVLISSSVQLGGLIDRLRSAHELCTALEGTLRSEHFDSTVGQAELAAIQQVIQSLEGEESIDDVWLHAVRSIKKEFDVVLGERNRKTAEEKRKRLGFKSEWEDATAERKRMPKATGHRDS